ncbi:response regulator [Anabaena sphaerica FACHB-251]|uniref:histidine kinase n=1 Tax=Anabaena sphaerica FACHB-251 TaxID=2692883 RepID=A0A926WH16_9NOST|nr:EAL domain-containing protein [Anabaena sphaerica]MBD2294357.1 response regulator [Anabaena sphaerica FACHB-251]
MNKILIIEDDAQIRDNIQQILDLEGFSTITAEDGWHGLQMAEQHQPDMIICDLMMPHLDGYGLIKALRQKPGTAAIPFIFITAKSERADLRRAMELGADDYLTKPFQVDEFLQVITTRLEKHQIVSQYYRGQIEQMESQLNYLARHDSLTGLPNQLFVEEHFNQIRLQAYSQGQLLPLLLIDIDILNRNKFLFEPTLRCLLLKAIAERLSELNSPHQIIDLIAYLKTDQIVLLLKPNQDSQVAADIAQQILDHLSQPLLVNHQQISVKTKIGIVCYPDDGLQLNELLTHAELALEHFKHEDTTSYHFYNQELFNILCRKIILETDLWHALERNEFELYYQPQCNVKTGKFVGVEALIRWRHPEYGLVSPGEFIPISEESGFIIPLGKWILKTACSQLEDLRSQGLVNLDLAVNISANQFKQQNFIQDKTFVRSTIEKVAFRISQDAGRASDLTIEISDAMINISQLKLSKIAEEIIDNAFKFSQPNTPVKIIGCSSFHGFNLYVIDSGRGMNKEQIASVGGYVQFERKMYEQQGSGLGLSIAKRLVEIHGGELSIESLPGKQTIIRMVLPQ